MSDNETFYWQGLILIGAVLGGTAGVLISPWPAITLGGGIVLITSALLIWHTVALRLYRVPGNALLVRPPWVVLGSALVLLGVAAVLAYIPVTGDNYIFFVLPLFLLGMIYGGYLPTTLLFYVASPDALTRQVLSFKKTLPWHSIDWIYGKRKKMTQEAFAGIPVARWTEETLFVEAGPRRRIVVALRAPAVRSNTAPLLEAIRERATNALFGFDQYPAVAARRADRPVLEPNLSNVTHGPFDPARAAAIARSGELPSGWVLFPLRRRNAWQNALSFSLFGIFVFVMAIVLYVDQTFLLADWVPLAWRSEQTTTFLLIAQAVVLVACAVGFFVAGLRWFAPLRALQNYFFLITPLGFLEAKGTNVQGMAYADMREVHLGSGMLGWQLVARPHRGEKLELDIGRNYGPGRELYAYVLSGLDAYRQARSSTRAQTGLGSVLEIDD